MTDADSIRLAALDRIDRSERHFKLAFLGAAVVETAFLVGFLLLADLHNRMHLLLLLATVATYTIVAAGLAALGAHVSRNTQRVLRAIANGRA